jgi:hypothetical protein
MPNVRTYLDIGPAPLSPVMTPVKRSVPGLMIPRSITRPKAGNFHHDLVTIPLSLMPRVPITRRYLGSKEFNLAQGSATHSFPICPHCISHAIIELVHQRHVAVPVRRAVMTLSASLTGSSGMGKHPYATGADFWACLLLASLNVPYLMLRVICHYSRICSLLPFLVSTIAGV